MSECELSLVCAMKWRGLSPSGNPDVRHCEACNRAVVMSRSDADREVSFALGRCVAIAGAAATPRWIGRAAAGPAHEDEPTNQVRIRRRAPLLAEQETLLMSMYPLALSQPDAQAALRAGDWLSIGWFTARVAQAVVGEIAGNGMPLEVCCLRTGASVESPRTP